MARAFFPAPLGFGFEKSSSRASPQAWPCLKRVQPLHSDAAEILDLLVFQQYLEIWNYFCETS